MKFIAARKAVVCTQGQPGWQSAEYELLVKNFGPERDTVEEALADLKQAKENWERLPHEGNTRPEQRGFYIEVKDL